MIAGTDRTWTVDDATQAKVTLDLAGSRLAVPFVQTNRADALRNDATAFRGPPLTSRPRPTSPFF